MGGIVKLFSPFIYGFVFAYILNRPMMFIQNKLLGPMAKNKSAKKLQRPLALVLTYLLVIVFITSFFAIIIPQLISSVSTLIEMMQAYIPQVEQIANDLAVRFGLSESIWNEIIGLWSNIYNEMVKFISNALPIVLNSIKGITASIANVFIGIIVSIYLLMSKEKLTVQFKKVVCAFAPKNTVERIMNTVALTDKTFGGFITGQLTVAFILGVLCFISMSLLKMPYALLVSVIIGTTNIIPYFGPIIGAVPCTFIILMNSPMQALYFVILAIVLQQVDGNLISPRIVGDSVGLSGLWVLFAITVGGGLFGLIGMVAGVPAFAVIYALFRELIYKRLDKRGIEVKNDKIIMRNKSE